MKSEFENSLGHTDGFHDGYVKWNELSNQYESSDEDYLDVAEWMNGALAIYEKRQTEIDELKLQVADMKSRLNDAYTDGQSAMYQHQQSKMDDLQRRNQMLNDNIKEQGQKLVYQNEVIETQAEKLLGLRDENAELQKSVDAVKGLIEDLNKCYQQDHQNKFEYWRGFADSAGILGKRLEQALKGCE